jgi:dihydroceramidase
VEGYWTGLGEPALVDWCEPNYVVSAFVAEWWNTLSSLYMAGLGAFGLAAIARHPPRQRRTAAMFALLGLVGLGSAAFHGTLLRVSQAADELPMIYLGLVLGWSVAQHAAPREAGRRLAGALAVWAALFTVAYFRVTAAFELFLAAYGASVLWMVGVGVRATFGAAGTAGMRRLFLTAVVGFLGTLATCWVPEHVLLPCDHPAQALQLHALWHLGAGTGTYAFILWALEARRVAEARGLTLPAAVSPSPAP